MDTDASAMITTSMAAVDLTQESYIEILNLDTLLVVFNLLSLYDRLMAMRVCKKWHQILSSHHAWTVIDFTEEGPQRKVAESCKRYKRFMSKTGPNLFEYRECGNAWRFPQHSGQTEILTFLKLYAGNSLQELYMSGIGRNVQIIEYVARNCPNIKSLQLHSSTFRDSSNELPLLSNLQYLQKLHVTGSSLSAKINNELITCISKCPQLQSFSIDFSYLSLKGVKKLSEMTRLVDLDLRMETSIVLIQQFESTIGTLPSIRSFRLKVFSRNPTFMNNMDESLIAIGNWTHLRHLALYSNICQYTDEAFEEMVSGLINLQSLELERCIMRTTIVTLIGNYLQNLTSLKLAGAQFVGEDEVQDAEYQIAFQRMFSELVNLQMLELKGNFTKPSVVQLIGTYLTDLKSLELPRSGYSAESLQTLSFHPTLENLELKQSEEFYQHDITWFAKVYKVVATLPKIRKVKVTLWDICLQQVRDIRNTNLATDSVEIEVISAQDQHGRIGIPVHKVSEEKNYNRESVTGGRWSNVLGL